MVQNNTNRFESINRMYNNTKAQKPVVKPNYNFQKVPTDVKAVSTKDVYTSPYSQQEEQSSKYLQGLYSQGGNVSLPKDESGKTQYDIASERLNRDIENERTGRLKSLEGMLSAKGITGGAAGQLQAQVLGDIEKTRREGGENIRMQQLQDLFGAQQNREQLLGGISSQQQLQGQELRSREALANQAAEMEAKGMNIDAIKANLDAQLQAAGLSQKDREIALDDAFRYKELEFKGKALTSEEKRFYDELGQKKDLTQEELALKKYLEEKGLGLQEKELGIKEKALTSEEKRFYDELSQKKDLTQEELALKKYLEEKGLGLQEKELGIKEMALTSEEKRFYDELSQKASLTREELALKKELENKMLSIKEKEVALDEKKLSSNEKMFYDELKQKGDLTREELTLKKLLEEKQLDFQNKQLVTEELLKYAELNQKENLTNKELALKQLLEEKSLAQQKGISDKELGLKEKALAQEGETAKSELALKEKIALMEDSTKKFLTELDFTNTVAKMNIENQMNQINELNKLKTEAAFSKGKASIGKTPPEIAQITSTMNTAEKAAFESGINGQSLEQFQQQKDSIIGLFEKMITNTDPDDPDFNSKIKALFEDMQKSLKTGEIYLSGKTGANTQNNKSNVADNTTNNKNNTQSGQKNPEELGPFNR